jgi:hypothetical protein
LTSNTLAQHTHPLTPTLDTLEKPKKYFVTTVRLVNKIFILLIIVVLALNLF